ncbi:hypothetical protein DIURU_000224 [Diutina rugosa]|uniref:C2H2-type domain-containing protein n=1 Tax=Diutina rugosa TaxID=5481 RepID=A0A642UYJ2_DIURU|nr:uncharacterized protein DIURU_000224 [Diutina rugosa]KAA8908255.1 hypothetical protein DIURU_000224 [Diutina rugosa]
MTTPVVPTQPIPKKSQQIKTDKPRPHICTVCTRAFARLEHLKRHERSHTNEKPFQCAACGRCFARRDLVLRHQQKLHSDLPNLLRRGSEVSASSSPSASVASQQQATGNEHIIVLSNNTSANAPLPKDLDSPYSPPNKPRLSVGSAQAQLPSPIPTTLSQNTPPWMGSKSPPKKHSPLNGGQTSSKSTPTATAAHHTNKLLQGAQAHHHQRHNSFSAASGTSYAGVFDPEGLNDKNFLFSGLELDMETFGWHTDQKLNESAPLKNLSQMFIDNATSAMSFSDTSHPHHLPGSTPPVQQYQGSPPALNHHQGTTRPRQQSISIAELDSLAPPAKKLKVDSLEDPDDEWLRELISVDAEHMNQEQDLLEATTTTSSPLSSLFRTRQHDLRAQAPSDVAPYQFITVELRNRILLSISRSDSQFPSVDELNHYMNLYEMEFNRYFPFIHLPSLKNPRVDNVENIPLLLAMCSIGALYSFAETHTSLLFNLSKFHIQRFFESEIMGDNQLKFNKVPLMAHQCLVLHVFISLFLNEANMVDITSRQIKSMIGLIRSTRFNEPLEKFLIPPSMAGVSPAQYLQNKFDYFIMAQSRIRTLHVFYMIQTLRAAITGKPVLLTHSMLASGTHCCPEALWQCQTANQLTQMDGEFGMASIVDMANGRSMHDLVKSLRATQTTPQLSLNNYLALLVYINEQLQKEVDDLHKQNPNGFNYFSWKLTHKPHLMALVKQWEQRFATSGLPLMIDGNNKHLLSNHHELKLILPLHSYLQIRLEININEIMSCILHKQWDKMNRKIDTLIGMESRQDNCRNAVPFALNIVLLWVHNIELINYDIKQTALRTPVFFVVCLSVAMLVISTYLEYLESLEVMSDNDLLNWFEMESVLLRVDKILTPIFKSLYSEQLLNSGVFNSISGDHRVRKISNLISRKEVADEVLAQKLNSEICAEVKSVELSIKSLYLGIRILADAPVWPIALGFGEAMKKRARHRARAKTDD